MKISKKQLKFVELIEKCGFLFESEIDNQEYPESLVTALVDKGLIARNVNTGAITSVTIIS